MRKMKRLRNAVMLSMLTTSVVWGGTAFANAADLQEFDLDTMVVTASRVETAKVDTPANVSVVTAEKIENRHYQNVAEALKDVPGASVIDGGVGSTEKKIILNGDDRVLVLIDGKRANFDVGVASGRASSDLNQLPDVSIIDRIEVVKGHGGALYGSDAVGGVVNIITKKMDHNYGKVAIGFGSNQARDAKAMYTIKEGKTGVMVAASKYKQGYSKYKDAVDGATKRWGDNTSFDSEKVSLKVAQELSETTNLTVGYDFSKLNGFAMTNPTASATLVDKKTSTFNVKYDWLLKGKDEGYVQLYHTKYNYSYLSSIEEKDNGFELQQAITTSENNKLLVGASYRNAHVDSQNSYNEKINNKAIFVSDQWEFIPTWTLDAGVRYDDHSQAGDKTTWSAGLNKKFDENSHAYFNWGQVFKAPTTDDVYGDYTGVQHLKPEKGDTWTVGYGTKLNDKTSINISYFQSNLEDAIRWYSTNPTDWSVPWHPTNIDEQKKNGMELSLNHEINDNWDVEASYSYVRVRNNKNDGLGYVRDTNYVPNMYRLGVRYHNDLWNADLFLRAGSGADKASYMDSSFVTVDASVAYKATKDLSFYAKGYNLFNRAYSEQGGLYSDNYYYPAQSRRFIIGAEYSF